MKDVLYRRWNASHGGVYVPVTLKTPPNPYLSDIPDRDVTTTSGKHLTLINPAYMTRQVYELMAETGGVKGHITSLKPIRPENAADPWETEALLSIEQGNTDISSISRINGKMYYRKMYAFITEAMCLKCHAKQGYREGDIRGGISVAVSLEPLLAIERGNIVTFTVVHGLLWLIGLVGITYSMQRIKRSEEERNLAYVALRQSETNYRIVADNTYDWEFWLSPEGKYIYISPSCERITGYPREDFLADPELIYRIVHPEDTELYKQHCLTAGEREPGTLQYRIIRRDGVERWIEHCCQSVLDDEGNFLGTRGSNRDITHRKQAEEEVRHFASFTASLINSLPGIFYLFDENGRLLRWNKHAEAATGYSEEELSSMTPLDFFGEDVREMVTEKIQEVFTVGQSSMEANLALKDGRKIPYLFTGQSILLDGKKYLIGMGVDITERKKTEEDLKKLTEELRRSNIDLQHFAYVTSHDLKEPLRNITSFVGLLEKRYKDSLDEKAHEYMNYIVYGAKRMRQLIDDLLEYSRVTGKDISLQPIDSRSALTEAIANLQTAIKKSEAVITYDKLPTVVADATQLCSLFQNLIGNAIKYRGKDLPQIHISAERKENEWIFSVRDNGIGIDPEFQERIFIIFQRLHARDEYSGTGIGLAVCKKIVERHGGQIWFESEVGKGSTFFFTLPAERSGSYRG
jgi:PAS domain S-box-containing protein